MAALEVVPYDPSWPRLFDQERERLSRALGDVALRIDHNGSTSVPGLAAKPVIDIQISVRALQPMDEYRVPLRSLGYTHVPHEDDAIAPYFHLPRAWPHTHHVHVVAHGGLEERRQLAFRDYLRAHAGVAADYARLKMELAPRYESDDADARNAYANAKGAFIERVIAIALAHH